MTPRVRIALGLVGALALVFVSAATGRAVPCPTTATFEGSTLSDVGFSGIGHQVDTGALAIPLALSNCAGTESGSCGSCDVSGPLVSADGRNRRCGGDLSVQCVVDADCGAAGPCRTYAGPPGPIEAGGYELCVVSEIVGSVTGTAAPDAGSLAITVPLDMRVIELHSVPIGGFPPPYFNPSYRPCPTCEAGTCQGGARDGLPCQVDAVNPVYGDTSFDCPSTQTSYGRFLTGNVAFSTATQTVTLTSDSPNCKGTGIPGSKCYCDTCNDAAATPCMSNADCAAVGATICGGKRCIPGGTPCSTSSQCGSGSVCGYLGEGTKPDGCAPPDGDPPDGCQPSGVCGDGPFAQKCAAPEAHRYCTPTYASETCPLTSACTGIELRRCLYDDGSGVSVSGVATPPVGGVSSTAVGALFCSGAQPTGGSLTNVTFGFPGLVRVRSEGTLAFGDGTPVVAPTPQPTGTPTASPTPGAGNCPATPASCRGAAGTKLAIRRTGDAAKRALQWQWRKGAATLLADFGDPLTTDPYELCVYDQGQIVASIPVAPGGTCQGKPCWRAAASKLTFRSHDTALAAATRVDLKSGSAGKSAVTFAAAGPHLLLPGLGTLVGPLDVQLQSYGSGVCWGSTFTAPFDRLDVAKGTLQAKN